MPKFIYINNKVVKFIDQFTWCKLTNSLSNFHNFLHCVKICNEKEYYINIKWELKGRVCGGPTPWAADFVCGSLRPSASPGQMGRWQSYSCSPNCPLSVLLILWFQVHVFQRQLSCEVADTFLAEWQSCLKPKNVVCQFQLRLLLSRRRLA